MMKKIFLQLLLAVNMSFYAQETAEKKVRDTLTIYSVDAASVKEVAKASEKKHTLFFTFGIWCEPCRLHLPTAIKLAKDYDLDFYVLLVDSEKSEAMDSAADYVHAVDKDIKIAVLSDETYGVKRGKRNKKFLTEITPLQFENIDGYSKYILLNKQGEVIMVTNWKDNRDNDWRDDSKMVQQKIVPLLQ